MLISYEFFPGSREEWVDVDVVHLDASYRLTADEIESVDKISKMLINNQFGRGIPFILCQREDFSFSDVAKFNGLTDPKDAPVGKKKRMHQFVDALPPHLAIRIRHAKLSELRKAIDSRSRQGIFERSSTSQA